MRPLWIFKTLYENRNIFHYPGSRVHSGSCGSATCQLPPRQGCSSGSVGVCAYERLMKDCGAGIKV